MALSSRTCALAVALAIACSAAWNVLAAEPALVLLAPASDAPEAAAAAGDLSLALAGMMHTKTVGKTGDPRALLAAEGARAIVIVEASPEAFRVSAMGSDGRSWPARRVLRQGPDAIVREQLAAVVRSMASAIVTNAPTPQASSSSSPSPSTMKDEPPAALPVADAAPPPASVDGGNASPVVVPVELPKIAREAPSAPVETFDALARIDAAFVGAMVGTQLGFQPGVSIGGAWLRSPVQIGGAYAFYPGANVDGGGASLTITRHTLAIGARVEATWGRLALSGIAGPMAEVWVRSTRASAANTNASPSSTRLTAAAFGRVGVTYWALTNLGVDGGIAIELAPGSPHFQGPSGTDVLTPNVVRTRFDLGLTARFR